MVYKPLSKVTAGRLVNILTSRGVRLARVIAADLPPSPFGNHGGSDKYSLCRVYDPRREGWTKHTRPVAKSAIVKIWPKDKTTSVDNLPKRG